MTDEAKPAPAAGRIRAADASAAKLDARALPQAGQDPPVVRASTLACTLWEAAAGAGVRAVVLPLVAAASVASVASAAAALS